MRKSLILIVSLIVLYSCKSSNELIEPEHYGKYYLYKYSSYESVNATDIKLKGGDITINSESKAIVNFLTDKGLWVSNYEVYFTEKKENDLVSFYNNKTKIGGMNKDKTVWFNLSQIRREDGVYINILGEFKKN